MKILLCLLLFIIFLVWTFLMLTEKSKKIDDFVYNSLKFKDNKTKILRIITNLGSTIYFVLICTILFFLLENKRLAFFIIGAMLIDALIVFIIKHIIRRERPNKKRLVEEKGYSYPSGHTFSATCFYGLLIFLTWISPLALFLQILITIFLILLIVSIGFSRIYLGVHYFSDVIGGLLLSSCYVILYVYIVYDVLKML